MNSGIHFNSIYIFIDDIISRSVTVELLMGTSAKPSFLIWDKVYQKLSEAEDARWLLRATDLAVPRLESELVKHQNTRCVLGVLPFAPAGNSLVNVCCRVALGAVFVHLAVHTTFSDVRRATTGMLAEAVMKRPQLLNAVLRDALTASLTKSVASGKPSGTPASSFPPGEEQEKPVADKRGRYAAILLACASLGEGGLEKAAREVLIVNWVVLAHHPAICTSLFFSLLG